MFNKVILIGRLGQNAEAKTAQNNREYVNFLVMWVHKSRSLSCRRNLLLCKSSGAKPWKNFHRFSLEKL
ncbi:single-stranded DNA-binding protein [Tunturiibacter gelidiferens]